MPLTADSIFNMTLCRFEHIHSWIDIDGLHCTAAVFTTGYCRVIFNPVWRMAKEDQKSTPGSKVDIYTYWCDTCTRSNTLFFLFYNHYQTYKLWLYCSSSTVTLQQHIKRSNMSFFLCFVTEVFFLFGLYDYDRSGLLDGLEMMKLVSDYNSHHTPGAQANEQVSRMAVGVCVWAALICLFNSASFCFPTSGGLYGRFFTPDSGSKPEWAFGPIRAAVSCITSHTGAVHVHTHYSLVLCFM